MYDNKQGGGAPSPLTLKNLEVKDMTQEQVKALKVGSRVVDLLDDTLEVVKIDGLLYELKWVHEDGTLSKGSQIAVPSHFEYMRLA